MMVVFLLLQLTQADCERDPRCRIEQARLVEAERARQAYLQAVANWAEDLEERELAALPVRERHPLGVDFQYTSIFPKWTAAVGYTLAWPIRVEFFGGRTTKYENVAQGNVWLDETVSMTSFGFQTRWFWLPSMFTPYLSTSLSWLSGSFDVNSADRTNGMVGFSTFDAAAHMFSAGIGVDLQWEWLHGSIGYRFDWAYYTRATDPMTGMHVEPVRSELSKVLDEWQHGIEFMIGARY